MDIMTILTNTVELLKFAFNIEEFIDLILSSLKENYGSLFQKKEETADAEA